MEEFGLNLDETRLMFSLQYFLTLRDVRDTRDRKYQNIKKQWLQSFQNSTELFLSNQAKQQQQPSFDCHLITDTETLLNRVRNIKKTPGSQLTKLFILLEVTLFVPYYSLQSSQDSQYKKLKLSDSHIKNKYCQSLAKAMGLPPDCVQRFQENYKKAMEGISGQWTNLLGGGLVGGLLLVVATAFFTPAIAALLAPILAPGLSGAAAVSAVLAALGGGAIAAGGFGMAGGFAVLVAGGAILGGGAGAGMGSLLARSPDAALTQAAKLEVVMKELVDVQQDIRKAQEIIKEQRQAIRSLEDKLDELLVDKKKNKEKIENLKKAIKYLQEALKRNRDLL
jgi:tetratricopeptide (TPR) repeat protein